ncbi:NAD synthetase [Pseudomonas sp. CBSPBW29]|uniref:NAD synthetase n=2 Tax=unclassified Pseudomonas TaxID=196821 RepID=UPI0021AB9D8E|nr:NAD synthetase [Pseudomonas sp. CBS]WEL44981.1 NAD synthetase [Pseudomonas sp. CBSPBW29]WEL66077.1 NAD synthetase [Pseudomonas sp. CBSPGW29]WEL84873.1 NAD synthetase [Pseudomonas sp. CBSPCAW29]WEL87685.1 NAD synthetase [Pseudomonas sp. CBSPCBW29]UVH50260.1 NAD synthetase [Pseudomonas sp. CBS]
MTSSLLKDGFPSAHLTTRQRVESSIDVRRLFAAIDADPAIIGAGVVYLDGNLRAVVLREFQPICSIVPKKVILREAPRSVGRVEFIRRLEHEPRESQVVFELLNTALACTAALISWRVAISGTSLIPFSAGASGVVTAIGVSAGLASGVQCLNGFVRVRNELFNSAQNNYLDSDEWYQAVTAGLDAASLLGAGVTSMATIRLVTVLRKTTGKSLRQVLKGLNRQERVRLTNELLSINRPEMTRKLIKLKQRMGDMPRRYSSAEIRQGTIAQIQDAIGAALGVAGSAMSGNIRTIAVGLYEEVSE